MIDCLFKKDDGGQSQNTQIPEGQQGETATVSFKITVYGHTNTGQPPTALFFTFKLHRAFELLQNMLGVDILIIKVGAEGM